MNTERRIEAALRGGRVAEARDVAVAYERRIPGPESWALLGRAWWRLGGLDVAEAFHRRAAGDGHPEGRLGLARALAARGDFPGALDLASPTLQVSGMVERAGRFVAALYWRQGDTTAAASALTAAAAGAGERRAVLESLAAAVGAVRGGSPGQPVAWRGAMGPASTKIGDGATWVDAEVGGRVARLRFDPMRWRSSVAPEFAAHLAARSMGSQVVVSVRVAGLEAATVPLSIASIDSAGDGILGFDLLVDLGWLWTPATGELQLGTGRSPAETTAFQQELSRTHWVSVRTLVDGLAVQLALVPRIGQRPQLAAVAPDGAATVTVNAARRAGADPAPQPGDHLRLLTRVGGWDGDFDYRVAHEIASAGQLPVPLPVTLPGQFARNWTWRWTPGSRQLALIERGGAAAGQ